MTPRFAQIALCTTDVPRSVQLYTEVFGFADAGGRALWGERIARMQALGDDTAFVFWWLVGRQDMLQLELFHHTTPRQRAPPTGRRTTTAGRASGSPCRTSILPWSGSPLSGSSCSRSLLHTTACGEPASATPTSASSSRCWRRARPRRAGSGRGSTTSSPLSSTRRSRCPTSPWRGASSSRRSASPRSRKPSSTRRSSRHSGASGRDPGELRGPRRRRVPRGRLLQRARRAALPDDHLLSDRGFMNTALGYREPEAVAATHEKVIANGYRDNFQVPRARAAPISTTTRATPSSSCSSHASSILISGSHHSRSSARRLPGRSPRSARQDQHAPVVGAQRGTQLPRRGPPPCRTGRRSHLR